ncbi:MAG: alpha-amylase family glycosyl hydrolase, partial [Flavobacteriaceae bacterium]|nr:alpha-amylase family glycosyl hydrolase [Flavobacteriaceae bacterium]
DAITITFDATGTALENATGTLYAHTGVTVNGSQWQNVVGSWGNNTTQPAFTFIGNNQYVVDITPDVFSFYGVPTTDVITEISLVVRNAAGNQQTSPDIFIPLFQPGFNIAITSPSQNELFSIGNNVTITATASQVANLELFVDGASIAQQNNATNISGNFTPTSSGGITISLEADLAGNILTDEVKVYVPITTPNLAKPSGVQNGVNENADGSLTFVLSAPLKSDVMLIGSFNDWAFDTPFQMNKDGDDFWVTVPASFFTADQEFAYQYVVDFTMPIADPYSVQVRDPNNDNFINPGNFPNLFPYPNNLTTGFLSLYTPFETPYPWVVTNFSKPDQENLVIYELLVRDFSEDDSFQEVINRLDYLENLGINAIEFMPVSEFEGNDSWGYNPSFHMALDKAYGTRNKFKELVDECHQRGIAVILDVVYNHAFGQSPLAQMWWDEVNSRPSPDNPYLNVIPTHDFNVGSDFNHNSLWTKNYVKQTLQYWVEEYKIDGFRFDLSKGFTQNNTLGNINAWNQFDQSRINILQDYANHIWNNTQNDIYLILEHLGLDPEEKVLADFGFMLWGKMTDQYNQNTMGFSSNSDVFRSYFASRNYNDQHLIAYAESHDEERLMYRNLQFGNSNGNYDIQTLATALERQEALAVLLYSIPGPKMLWQFGELGYDVSINFNGRLGRKPIPWTLNYDTDAQRLAVYDVTSTMINLKTSLPDIFNTTNNFLDVGNNLVKRVRLFGPGTDVIAVVNFDVIQ